LSADLLVRVFQTKGNKFFLWIVRRCGDGEAKGKKGDTRYKYKSFSLRLLYRSYVYIFDYFSISGGSFYFSYAICSECTETSVYRDYLYWSSSSDRNDWSLSLLVTLKYAMRQHCCQNANYSSNITYLYII